MEKAMNRKGASFLSGFRIGASVLLASLLIASPVLAENKADAPPDTSVVPGKTMQKSAETDTARTSSRDAELDKTISEMKVRLELTRVQETYIRSILKESLEKERVLREKMQGQGRRNRRSFMQELRTLREHTEKSIETVLTGKQVRAYRKLKEEQQEKMRKGTQRRGRRR